MTNWISQAFGMIMDSGYRLIVTLSILCIIFIPLGVWKAIELIIWLFKTIAPTPWYYCMKSTKTILKRARQRLTIFQSRSSYCSLCGNHFRHGCNHSIDEARRRLEENVTIALFKHRLSM